MHDFPFEDDIGQGPKMKEAFLKTGQFSDVHAVVKQLRTKKVKDEDTEKPVTKLMLKEIYKWDEC
jgi:alpha-N-acetylglucosamine transferase